MSKITISQIREELRLSDNEKLTLQQLLIREHISNKYASEAQPSEKYNELKENKNSEELDMPLFFGTL